MSSTIHIEGALPEEQKKRKTGFFGGLVEGIRSRREAESSLGSYLVCADPDALKDAAGKFASLSDKGKAKLLGRLQKRLSSMAQFPYESERRLESVIAIADFLAEAARHCPPELKAGCIDARSDLQRIVTDPSFYNHRNELHRAAKLCCTSALWELEGGGREFWEERLLDDATMDFTIKRLLSRVSMDEPEESGWPILRRNLPKIALAIALCQSDKKEDFFTSMLMDSDPLVLKSALAGSLYLPRIPPEFFDIARDISGMGSGLDFASFAFSEGVCFKNMLVYADERQFEGAIGLAGLYAQGASHLAPLLAGVVQEMADIISEPPGSTEEEKLKSAQMAAEVLVTMSRLSIPGVHIDIHMEG